MNGLTINEDELGLDAIRDVGPGGHYFGTAHTMSRYKTAFYSPILSDWRNFESWTEAGSPTALQLKLRGTMKHERAEVID